MAEDNTVGLLPKALRLIGLLFAGMIFLVGALYTWNGNIPVAGFLAFLAGISFYVLTYFLQKYKTRKASYRNYTPEIALGVVYLFAFLAVFPFSFHFVDIEFNRKDAVKAAALGKLEDLKNLKANYDKAVNQKANTFETGVRSLQKQYFAVGGKDKRSYRDSLIRILGNGIAPALDNYESSAADPSGKKSVEDIIKNQVEIKKDLEKGRYALDENLSRELVSFFTKSNIVFSRWNIFEVSFTYNQIDTMYSRVYQGIQEKMPAFQAEPVLAVNPIKLDAPMASFRQAGIGSLLVVLLILAVVHLCILLPYLLSKRPAEILKKTDNKYQSDGAVNIDDLLK